MRLFARGDSPPWSARRSAPSPCQAGGRRPRREARPAVEALDPRRLMASGVAQAADVVATPALSDAVANVLQPYLAQDRFPGISVAVVSGGKVVLAQGFGTGNVKTGVPVDADTRFDIGSLTKTFTAIGVLRLYQDSQGTSRPLDLNAPIGDYLHNTRSFKLPRKWSGITTMELLNMSSGIPEVEDGRPWRAQLATAASRPLRFAPGTASAYSDTNYYLLGELIEQWTGEPYGQSIQERILDPVGMPGSQVLGRTTMVSSQAVGYGAHAHRSWPVASLWNGTSMYAAAGMVSTARDMGAYMTTLLAGGLLDPSTERLMWTATPTPHFASNPAYLDVRGLGWDTAIDSDAGVTEVTKSGSVRGYTSQLILYPSTDSGVYISFNANYGGSDPSGAVATRLAEQVYQAVQSASPPGG